MAKPVASNHDRFWENVAKTDTCWLWTGDVPKSGYGQMSVRQPDGRWLKRQVHRMAYEIFFGPIPNGLEIDHLCFVPLCVNPDHLEAVTTQENARRRAERITHCPAGHPYGKNTYTWERPGQTPRRRCRLCNNENARRYRVRVAGGVAFPDEDDEAPDE